MDELPPDESSGCAAGAERVQPSESDGPEVSPGRHAPQPDEPAAVQKPDDGAETGSADAGRTVLRSKVPGRLPTPVIDLQAKQL